MAIMPNRMVEAADSTGPGSEAMNMPTFGMRPRTIARKPAVIVTYRLPIPDTRTMPIFSG
ncbi:hypothetical protein D3C75_1199100 [compost metagenome]